MMSKKYKYLGALFCFVLIISCGTPETILDEKEEVPVSTSTNLTITNGMTFTEINTVLKSAKSGNIIDVEAGTYTITGELAIKSGISLHKKTAVSPVFTAVESSPTKMLEQYWDADNSDISIYGIQFNNIRINLRNASNTSIKSCIFDYGIRKEATDKSFTQDAYIQLFNSKNILIQDNVFKRRIENSGRGIYIVSCEDTAVLDNIFGNDGAEGYFVTAINDNSTRTKIKGNIIHRIKTWVNAAETDHGIYAHSFNTIIIEDNTISGWPASAVGGALKIRNGNNALIQNNTMNTSGILMYVYGNTPNYPYFKNIEILNNTISVANSTDDIYHGIGYWRDTLESGFYEQSIKISGNILPKGRIKIENPINVTLFNENGGGVFNNDIDTISLVSGINNSGNY